MGVKHSKSFNEHDHSNNNIINNSNNSSTMPNLGYSSQLLNNPLAPNDFLAFQQHNSRYPMSMQQQQQQLQQILHHQQHQHQQLNMNSSHLTHSSARQPLSNSLHGSLSSTTRLTNLNDSSSNSINSSDAKNQNILATSCNNKNMNGTLDNKNKLGLNGSVRQNANHYRKKTLPTKSSLLQELLECPICMNLYDNPHVLPCQHTFCKNCLVSLQKNEGSNLNSSIDCPICREKHRLPNGVEGLAANYTMKRLIELESMAAAEKDKNNKEKAKCVICLKFCHLHVCNDCSYMLCLDCLEDPNHDILIESKITSRKKKLSLNQSFLSADRPPPPPPTQVKHRNHQFDYPERANVQTYGENFDHKYMHEKLKLILLCHSSAIELNSDQDNETYSDEFGKCKTFGKIAISPIDRLITLKKLIENRFGIASKDQILVYKDKILKNDLKQIESYQVKQYSRIHVFDARDIKENGDELDYGAYGIYQDAADYDESISRKIDNKRGGVVRRNRSLGRDFYYDDHNDNNKINNNKNNNYFTQVNDSNNEEDDQYDEDNDSEQNVINSSSNRNYSANINSKKCNKIIHRPKFPQIEKKPVNLSSSSQSYSSVVAYSSNDESSRDRDLNFQRRNKNYRTMSIGLCNNKVKSTNIHVISQNYTTASAAYDIKHDSKLKPIMGQIRNLRRGSVSATNYSQNSFRLRKLDELFSNEN